MNNEFINLLVKIIPAYRQFSEVTLEVATEVALDVTPEVPA